MSEVTISLEILLLAYYLSYEYLLYCFTLLKLIAGSRGFIFPEAFRLTLVKGIVRIKNVELRPLVKARREKREVVSDWTKSVDQSKTEALVRDFQRVDKLFLPAQDWLRNFDVSGFDVIGFSTNPVPAKRVCLHAENLSLALLFLIGRHFSSNQKLLLFSLFALL